MGELEQLVDEVWKHFDTDGSGSLDRAEATKFLKKICENSALAGKED